MKNKIKHIILSALAAAFISANLFSQVTDSLAGEQLDSLMNSGQICFDPVPDNDSIQKEEIFILESLPQFPGGNIAFKEWMKNNIKYPDIPKEGAVQGTVFIKFEVTKTGDIGTVNILKGIDPYLDKEAIKIVKSLPKFEPAIKEGTAINSWMLIPVKFELN